MEKSKDNNTLKVLIKAISISFAFTIVLFLLFSLVLSYTNLSEKFINPVIIVITIISIFLGSMIVGRNRTDKGMLFGGISSLIYIFLLYIISSIITKDFSFNSMSLIMIACSIFFGMIGGIIGINSRNK